MSAQQQQRRSSLSESSDSDAPVLVPEAPETTDSSSSDDGDEKKAFLKKLIDAFRQLEPKEPEKGSSIVKIREYLRKVHHVRKDDMKRLLRPALEEAVERRIVTKTTGKGTVLLGSARLNPEYRRDPKQRRSRGTQEPESVVVAAAGGGGGRKRKAAEDDPAKQAKRRLPFATLGQ